MNNYHVFFFFVIILCISCNEIPKGLTIQEAEKQGIFFDSLNIIYKSAISVDTSNAVFKTETDMEKASIAYQNLLDEFGKYLTKNNFKWPFATTCFQKVYFSEDGKIDYFLFNFLGEPPYEVTADQEMKFKSLLNEFIEIYKYPITANMKYSQCGTIVYGLKKSNQRPNPSPN